MIKTPLSTAIGGAGIWTPGATTIGAFGAKKTFDQIIKSLFANNEQGFAYDPNDLTTMWQDQAKLLPVTGAGQPVWHILDKSGNNNHAFATSSATRPILQRNATTGAYYLAFDGSDDFLVTNSIDFTSTDEISLFAGVRKLSDVNASILCELSTSTTANNGSFHIAGPSSGGLANYVFASKGTVQATRVYSGHVAPHSAVLSAKSKISADNASLDVSGNGASITYNDQGTGNYGNYPLYIGRRAGTSLPFNGHIYSLIGVGRLTTDAETIALEKLIAKDTGVTLSV